MSNNKNIQIIAPLLANDFVDMEESIFDMDNYSILLEQNSARLGLFKKYLVCKLHDSWIIQINQDNDNLKIALNDFSTYVFADTLIEKFNLSIDSDNISFPLTIELEGDLKVEYNSVNDDGELEIINPIKLDVYLYEQVIKLDKERVEIVFHFWKSNLEENKPGEKIIMIASAKNLTLIEDQDRAWIELFGKEFDSLYKYFKAQFDSDRYVSDHNECEKIIEEYEQMINKRKPTA